MNAPWVKVGMASLFTIVFITACFILVGGLFGERVGPATMMFTVLFAGVIGWVIAERLFRLKRR